MEIIWSENAQITFEVIVNYLEQNFGVLVTKEFIAKIDAQIRIISKFPELNKAVSIKNAVRKAIIKITDKIL